MVIVTADEHPLARIATVAERWLELQEQAKAASATNVESPRPQVLTPAEVAAALRLHVQTVMRWCREGEIAATKIGRKWLVPRSEVDRQLTRYQLIHGRPRGS